MSINDPAFVPSEIADRLDVTTEGARHRMNSMADRNLLAKKKPGRRTVLYWITGKGERFYWDNSGAD